MAAPLEQTFFNIQVKEYNDTIDKPESEEAHLPWFSKALLDRYGSTSSTGP